MMYILAGVLFWLCLMCMIVRGNKEGWPMFDEDTIVFPIIISVIVSIVWPATISLTCIGGIAYGVYKGLHKIL